MKKNKIMEKVILKSMVAFVKEQIKNVELDGTGSVLGKIGNYANFLDQILNLGMFVPCDLDGNVLDSTYSTEPDRNDYFNDEGGNLELYHHNMKLWREYKEAKKRVLFEGLIVEKDMHNKTKRTFCFIGNKRIFHVLEFHSGELKVGFDLFHDFNTIENLTKLAFELTPSAKKLIGL